MKSFHPYFYFMFLLGLIHSSSLYASECSFTCPPCGSCTPSSHSALIARPIVQNVILELGMTNYFRYDFENNCSQFFLDISPFTFISTNSRQLAHYLFPNSRSTISVAENNTSDISAPWLNITTPIKSYSSLLEIRPQRIELGFTLNFFMRLNDDTKQDWTSRTWLSAFMPVEWVRHNLRFVEMQKRVSPSMVPSPFASAVAAFNSPLWRYGKLSCGPLNTGCIADILFRLGYDFILHEESHLALYAATIIPTFHGLKSHYLFEPTLGNLGHFGLGFGLDGAWSVFHRENLVLNWITDFRYLYFFGRHETRSSDLFFNEDWSRYLQVAEIDALETPLPGINFFTQSINIKPRSSINFWTALHIQHCDNDIEFGYNFWWRQKESSDGFKNFPTCTQVATLCGPNVVIYDIAGTPGTRTSESDATIKAAEPGPGSAFSDPTPVLVTANDFAESSYLIPNVFISTLYASFGREYTTLYNYDFPTLISGGAYYDFNHHHSGFSGVGLWLKSSLLF